MNVPNVSQLNQITGKRVHRHPGVINGSQLLYVPELWYLHDGVSDELRNICWLLKWPEKS